MIKMVAKTAQNVVDLKGLVNPRLHFHTDDHAHFLNFGDMYQSFHEKSLIYRCFYTVLVSCVKPCIGPNEISTRFSNNKVIGTLL